MRVLQKRGNMFHSCPLQPSSAAMRLILVLYILLVRKQKKVFLTTALGAIVNLGTNLILVQPFGMQGIAMGTCLGYIAVLIVRVRDMWVEMGIRFDFKRNILTFIVLFIQSAVVIYFGGVLSVVISCAGILFIALLYRKEMVTN